MRIEEVIDQALAVLRETLIAELRPAPAPAPPVNKLDAPRGFVAVAGMTCNGCHFQHHASIMRHEGCPDTPCSNLSRADGVSVIFKPKPKPKKKAK